MPPHRGSFLLMLGGRDARRSAGGDAGATS